MFFQCDSSMIGLKLGPSQDILCLSLVRDFGYGGSNCVVFSSFSDQVHTHCAEYNMMYKQGIYA